MRQLLDGSFPPRENKITDFKNKHTDYVTVIYTVLMFIWHVNHIS